FWRTFGIVSSALAAASIAALAYIGFVPSARPPLLATLTGSAGQPNFVASVTATGNSLVIVPAALLTTDQRSFELWLIAAGDTRPPPPRGLPRRGRPAGPGPRRPPAAPPPPAAPRAGRVEPLGGPPPGLPTGPVIAAGKLTNL